LRTRGHEAATDLGGDHRRRLRATQSLAEPQLAQAEAVEGRGVEVAHACGEGFTHRGAGIFIGELAIQIADGCAAEPQRAQRKAGAAELAARERRIRPGVISTRTEHDGEAHSWHEVGDAIELTRDEP
jgi:hypothetical protein